MGKAADEFLDNAEIILLFGLSGLLYMTAPYYPDHWHDSDSAVRWGWGRLKNKTECVWWQKSKP